LSVGKRAGLESEFTQVKASFCNKPTSRAIKDTALDSSAFDQSSSPVTGPCGSFLSPPCGCCAPLGDDRLTPYHHRVGVCSCSRLFADAVPLALRHWHGANPVGCWKPGGGFTTGPSHTCGGGSGLCGVFFFVCLSHVMVGTGRVAMTVGPMAHIML